MDTIVLKKDADASRKRMKVFQKVPLELYQKQYHIYKNEFILSEKVQKTNREMIDNIYNKISVDAESSKPLKGINFQVQAKKDDQVPGFSKRFDAYYSQSINISMNDKCILHLTGSVNTKNDYGFYYLNPSLSYRLGQTYYRV